MRHTPSNVDSVEDTDDVYAETHEIADDLSASERGLRGLVGGGSSQVSVAAATRARDAARPRPTDVAKVEAELVIVRRHWLPRDHEGSAGTS